MNLNRRNFLFGSAAAAALTGCATDKIGTRTLKPGEKANVALIGFGIQGRSALMPQFVDQYKLGAQVVVVCDCDKERREAGAKMVDEAYAKRKITGVPKCRAVADFRDVLKDPSIDMVCIATPDHWHAYIAVEAMKAGKDVYCEKPLTFNVDEARKVIAAQAKYGRVFQTGSMQRSWDVFRTAAMIVVPDGLDAAQLGRVPHGGDDRAQRHHRRREVRGRELRARRAEARRPVPSGPLLRQAGERGDGRRAQPDDQLAPRGVNKFYPMFWRFDDDIGTGYNGDWGAHHLDIAQWGLDMDKSGPYKIIRSDEPYSTDLFHGGRRQFGMKMLFHTKTGDVELYHGPFGVWGTVFYGTNGIVAVNRGKIAVWQGTGLVKPNAEIRQKLQDVTFMKDKIVAESVGKAYKDTETSVKKDNRLEAALAKLKATFKLDTAPVQLYKSPNQVQNFVECYFSRKPTISPAEVGGRGAVLCQLCNMSYVYDTGFDWDPVKMDFANGTGKGISLKRDFCRNGWEVVV